MLVNLQWITTVQTAPGPPHPGISPFWTRRRPCNQAFSRSCGRQIDPPISLCLSSRGPRAKGDLHLLLGRHKLDCRLHLGCDAAAMQLLVPGASFQALLLPSSGHPGFLRCAQRSAEHPPSGLSRPSACGQRASGSARPAFPLLPLLWLECRWPRSPANRDARSCNAQKLRRGTSFFLVPHSFRDCDRLHSSSGHPGFPRCASAQC